MGDSFVRWFVCGGCAAVALLATACTAIVTSRRTYYPLLRLIFLVTAGVYATSAISAGWYWDAPHTPTVRVVTVAAALVLLVLCVAFIAWRNRVPQWVTTDVRLLAGKEAIDFATIDTALLTTLSLLRHGAASPEMAAQVYEALRRWEAHEAGRRSLRAELAERRRRKAHGIE